MSFPAKGCIRHKVCVLLREASMPKEAIGATLNMHTADSVSKAIISLDKNGFVAVGENGMYSLTRIMRRHLDQCEKREEVKPVGAIVPPRHVNLFTPAMTGYKLNTLGTRPEALEIMQARSKHL